MSRIVEMSGVSKKYKRGGEVLTVLDRMDFVVEAQDFVASGGIGRGGRLPSNTNGGQLSVGQAGSASGYLGVTETLRQLTGTAGDNQVANARHGLVSGFGMVNYDRGLCSAAAILKGAAA